MATSSFGFTTNYINDVLNETVAYRNLTTYLLPGETYNANFGSGPVIGSSTLPTTYVTTTIISGSVTATQYVYRGRIGSVYIYSIGSIPGGGATDIIIVGTV